MNQRFEQLRPSLVCPACRGGLEREPEALCCHACARSFRIRDGVPHLRLEAEDIDEHRYRRGLRSRLRLHPTLYRWVFRLLAPVLVTGPDAAELLAPLIEGKEGLVLDLGAGNDRRHPRFTNVDALGYPEVDLVADAEALPFPDNCVDGILSIALLEHVPNPQTLLAEAHRVLHAGGRLFIVAPFLQPFHAAPRDFRRWTVAGLTEELELKRRFRVNDAGVYCGPASAGVWLCAEWIALALSFGRRRVRLMLSSALQILLSPLKWLDLVLARLPGAADVASVVYVDAEKLAANEGPREA